MNSTELTTIVNDSVFSNTTQVVLLDTEETRLVRKWKIVVEIYIVGILCVFGIVGNLLSFCVLGRDKFARSTTRFLLQVLAITDTIYLFCCLVFQTLRTIIEHTDWIQAPFQLKAYLHLFIWGCAAIIQTSSVWLVVLITTDRYIAICLPLHAARYSTMTRVRVAVLAIGIFAILYNIPRFFESELRHFYDNGEVVWVIARETSLMENRTYLLLYKTFLFLIVRFLVPFCILAFVNTRLMQAVRDSYRRHSTGRGQNTAHSGKYSLTLIVVVLVFVGCELPDLFRRAYRACNAIFPDDVIIDEPFNDRLYIVGNAFLTLNSAVNFLIYCAIGKRFRSILSQMLSNVIRLRSCDKTAVEGTLITQV